MAGQLERMRVFLSVARTAQLRRGGARGCSFRPRVVTRYVARARARARRATAGAHDAARFADADAARPTLHRRSRSWRMSRRRTCARKQQQGELTGELRVSAPLSLGVRLLPPALARFRASASRSAAFAQPDRPLRRRRREGFDMALRVSGPPSDKSTIWRKICVVPRLLVAAPGLSARAPAAAGAARPRRHACIGYAEPADRRPLVVHPSRRRRSGRR